MEDIATLTIRKGLRSDLGALVDLNDYARLHSERVASISASLSAGECFIAEFGGDVRGFIVLNYTFFGFGFIPLIVVAERHRRRGVGLRLLSEAQRRCTGQKLFASANASNEAARALFKRAGFIRSGLIENLDDADTEIVYFKPSG